MQNINNIRLLFGKNKKSIQYRNRKPKANLNTNQSRTKIITQIETVTLAKELEKPISMPKKQSIESSVPNFSKESSRNAEEDFTDDVIICENNFVSQAANISRKNFNLPNNKSDPQNLITVPQPLNKKYHPKHPYIIQMMNKRKALNKQKHVRQKNTKVDRTPEETQKTAEEEQVAEAEKASNSDCETETNMSSEDVIPVKEVVDKEQEPKVGPIDVCAPEHTVTPSVPPKMDGQAIEVRLTNETVQKAKQTVCVPQHTSTSNVPPKTDRQTIAIRLTHELRQKDNQTGYWPNSANVQLPQPQAITQVNKRIQGNVPMPQQNVPPTATPYNQNQQGYNMNPVQTNQQYFNVPQYNQFLPPQQIQQEQLQTHQVFVPTPNVMQNVAFEQNNQQPNVSGLPKYNYLKGIPKSFYQGQEGNFLGNAMTLNFNPTQDTAHPLPTMPPVPQQPYTYGENVLPVMGNAVYTDNMNIATLQSYSPSQIFENATPGGGDISEGAVINELSKSTQKRPSAFERLGPVTKPKKPKLTINLVVNKDSSVREVVDESKDKETEDKYTPVYLRKDILASTDPTVLKHIKSWPWKKNIQSHKSVTARSSKTVMLLEREQMDEYYDGERFNQVSVTGYPPTWTKENVLDAILENVGNCPMIPCFTEFSRDECKFLVFRCRLALLSIHKCGFRIRKGDVRLTITISNPELGDSNIEFIPSLVLKQRLSMCYDGETKLNLTEFTTKSDISHFLYFPLNHTNNQAELTKLPNVVVWGFLIDLDLSHNRIKTISGFNLPQTTPKLKHLNLSHNLIEKVTVLLSSKDLSLRTIRLEGNPMCTDYTDPQHYVKVIKMIYPTVTEIDGLPVANGRLPPSQNNYCPDEAKCVVEKFLEVYFPLWDADYDQRELMKNLYDKTATLTNMFSIRLRESVVYRLFPSLFRRAHLVSETECLGETVEGNKAIAKRVRDWPQLQHDPFTFTVDVLHHNDDATIVRIGGMLKLTTESLADEEFLISFTRTVILRSTDGCKYKINREWILWDQPREECAKMAFQITTVKTKRISLELKSTPNNELKEKLIDIFMQITTMERKPSERCLEKKNWHLRHALQFFTKLLKLGDISCLTKD